jgi:pyruvate kinase
MTQIIKAVETSVNSSTSKHTTNKTKRFITKTICRHAAIMADASKQSNLYFDK